MQQKAPAVTESSHRHKKAGRLGDPAFPWWRLLHILLVGLDHFLHHLAADGAGFPGGEVTIVAIGQVDTDLPWCPFYILKSPNTGTVEGI